MKTKTKTIIEKANGELVEHIGTSGITITLDGDRIPPFINIEYDMVSGPEMVTMIKDLLLMAYEGMPGVAENATARFFEEAGLLDKSTGFARVKWKRPKE